MSTPYGSSLSPGLRGVALALVLVPIVLPGQRPPPREDAYRANNLGVAYLEQYDYEAAVTSFRRALAIDGSLTIARINLAIASLHAADLVSARREIEAALAAAPDQPHPHYILGLIAKAENRVDEAMRAFGRVLEMDERDVGARVHLAQLHLQQAEYERAVALLRPAVTAEPFHATALYTLALALIRGGRTDEGRQIMAEFQRIRDAGYATALSNNYSGQGRFAEALASTGAEPELVDPGPPRVRFAVATRIAAAEASDAPPPSSRARSVALGPLGRGMTLSDHDRDGDLDLFDVSSGTLRAFANDRGRYTDVTAKLRLPQRPSFAPVAVIAGDYDNDERPDLFVLGAGGHALHRQTDSGAFEDVTVRAGVPAMSGFFRSAAFVDVDHDGDLDLFLVGTLAESGEPLPVPDSLTGLPARASVLLRNNGNTSFTDITAASQLAAVPLQGYAVVPTDFDNRRDVDLLVAGQGHAPVLFKNLRDGSFRDVAGDLGLPGRDDYTAVAAADTNKDGFTDFFFGRAGEASILMLSDGRGGFREAAAAPALDDVTAAQFVDFDNDGLLDLVAVASRRLELRRNLGRAWTNVTSLAAPAELGGDPGERLHSLAAGDVDGDGDTDLVVKTGAGDLIVLENQGGSTNRSLTVRLTGLVSNRSGIGARVEMRAGSLRQRLEVSSAWPGVAPADLVFGLGTRSQADVVRVLWPAGILQSELVEGPEVRVLTLTELDRKPSSCPYLFAWNGQRFEFLTDFMGGGEMGYALAPGTWNTPDPEEYTRIPGDLLQPRDGRYEIRVTNELEEALFVDRLQLVAVDHPAPVEVHPREGLFAPPFPAFELVAAADIRPPVRAIDHAGRDVLERVRDLDRRFVDGLPLERTRGYAKEHALTLDLGPSASGAPVLLLLTGWTDYAFSSDNIAAHQAGLRLVPPSLQVRGPSNEWITVVPEVGIPVGRPQTLAVDLTGRFLSSSREVRILTTMRIYWDQIRVARRDTAVEPRLARLDPVVANLRWRGFSAEATPDGREPFTYEYGRVSPHSPWKTMPGRYTREGDVRELLLHADDMFIVSRPGDEIAIAFDASALGELPVGWRRTFLLHSVGYSKEMDRNSASPDHVWPLPFRAMTRYPYSAPETYPQTPGHREYLERWNTRVVRRAVPAIELQLPKRARNRR